MPATLRKLLLILPISLFVTAVGWEQTTAVEGEVKGLDGKGVKDAVVHLERKDMKGSYKVKTDKKGHYYYGGLPIGTFKISVDIDGKEADAVDNVHTKLGDPMEVPFDLKAAAARAEAGGGAPEKEVERGMSSSQKADYEKKRKENEEKMAKNKELNDAFNAGVEAENQKNWDVAITSFEKADPRSCAERGLGTSRRQLHQRGAGQDRRRSAGAVRQSRHRLSEGDRVKPDAPEYHNNYALALAKQKKFTEAQAELTKAAQLDPAQAGKYYYNMGAVLVNTGQMEPAGEAFKKAIAIDPNYADAHYQYGIYLLGKATTTPDGKITPPEGTAEEFQKYLQLQPTGPYAESAKSMLATIGSSVETQFKKKK